MVPDRSECFETRLTVSLALVLLVHLALVAEFLLVPPVATLGAHRAVVLLAMLVADILWAVAVADLLPFCGSKTSSHRYEPHRTRVGELALSPGNKVRYPLSPGGSLRLCDVGAGSLRVRRTSSGGIVGEAGVGVTPLRNEALSPLR